jgi:VWFA-related protein
MSLMPRLAASAAAMFAVAGFVSAAAQSPAGAPQATFRTGVDLVDVEVSVLDRYRLPVHGLTAADFTVLEEGQPRPVAAFTPVDLPTRERAAARWMTDVASDVQANDFGKVGRLIVILMDQSIDPSDGPEARRIAEAAVDQMRPGDLAAVAWTVYGVPQNFTADRRLLLEAIRQPSLNLPAGDTAESAACYCGACGLELMARVAEAVEDVRQRRKILLFVGHRLPQGASGCGGVIDGAQKRVLRAAEVGNLTIHVVDPKGVLTLAPSASRAGGMPLETPSSDIRRVATLTTYTSRTGGRFVTQNMASDALPEVFRESGSYYVLGFQPSYTRSDGRFRRITVKVNRPDVTVQARGGYYAPGRAVSRPKAIPRGLPAPLVQALAGLWPKTDVRLSVGATPVAMPGVRGGAVAVLLTVEQDLSPAGPLGAAAAGLLVRPHSTAVSVLTGAFDAGGRTYGFDRQTATVTPRPLGGGRFAYDVASRLELKPGHYEIRAAIEDSTLQQTGSAYTYVTVPDFAGETVSLSGVFLETASGLAPLEGAAIADLVAARPTTRRTFARTERVTAVVHSYQGQAHEARPGYMTTEIFNDADERVYQQELRIVPPDPDRRTATFSVDLPLDRLAPGEYVVTMQMRQGNASARRDVRFEIR